MFTRLQKLGVSLSHRATIDLIDEMGIGHDEAVLNWRDSLQPTIDMTEVCNSLVCLDL